MESLLNILSRPIFIAPLVYHIDGQIDKSVRFNFASPAEPSEVTLVRSQAPSKRAGLILNAVFSTNFETTEAIERRPGRKEFSL